MNAMRDLLKRLPRSGGFAAWWLAAVIAGAAPALPAAAPPVAADPRVDVSLFAGAPDIVTPIGAACDARGRLFVIESHTHLRAKDYSGPRTDRVKVFTDADADGRPERVAVFAEDFQDAMGLAFLPDGALLVLCAGELWRVADADGDGRAESRAKLVTLESLETYAHNRLLSVAVGPDGRIYLGRGNTGSQAWTLRGGDGSSTGGYGDGSGIASCNARGGDVRAVATGFWNPFGLEFDAEGRLLAVDNDPDARGPNRVVHVVPGGDYGYKSLYGGGGNHPFQAWNGELPGTLPYVSGTGEAPCAVFDPRRAGWPAGIADGLLVTVWGTHRIERHATAPRGISLRADVSDWLRGAEDFRPVAFATDGRGTVYVTDWVKVDYPVHGRGRIWRLRLKDAAILTPPQTPSRLWTPPAPATEAVRDGRWKLVRFYNDLRSYDAKTKRGPGSGQRTGAWELYDLDTDPNETRDLAKAHPERVANLASQHAAWAKRIGVIPREHIAAKLSADKK
jgi:putative membrane-bound dehydrogenase-like protein